MKVFVLILFVFFSITVCFSQTAERKTFSAEPQIIKSNKPNVSSTKVFPVTPTSIKTDSLRKTNKELPGNKNTFIDPKHIALPVFDVKASIKQQKK
jgi:hypothetical protein